MRDRKTKRKLSLMKETLIALDEVRLHGAAGGDNSKTWYSQCSKRTLTCCCVAV
jgi:hypothetical protein